VQDDEDSVVARLPVRVLGAVLLSMSLTVGSCQAFVGALPHVDGAQPIDQRDVLRDSERTP
jgi:hypothetical protein